jgi:hypothetical protein
MNKTLVKKMSVKPMFTIGGDPEIYIAKPNGEIQSSIPVLKRDKHNPIILDKGQQIKIYADNSLLEASFAPADNKKDFVNRFKTAFQKTQNYLGKNHRIVVKSAHFFKENELEAAHGIDPLQVGCNPEFSFWEKKINELGEFTDTMRSGSSHIHLGADILKASLENKENALKMVEIYLGLSSILWDNDETSVIRRKKYGTSGSFRITPWGCESRFMSNYMLNSPSLVELTYDLVEYSLSHIFNNTYQKVLDLIDTKEVQNAINNCDKALAEKLLKQANLPKELFSRVKKESKKKYSTDTFYKNWNIKV